MANAAVTSSLAEQLLEFGGIAADDTLDGSGVLPGFTSPIGDLFADLDFDNPT